jgi:hypothetical protein
VRVPAKERDSRRLSGPAVSGNKGINLQLFDNKANCKVDPRGTPFHDAPVSCSPVRVHRIARLIDVDTLLHLRSFTMSRALPRALGSYDLQPSLFRAAADRRLTSLARHSLKGDGGCPFTPCVTTWCAAIIAVGFGGTSTPFEMALSPAPIASQAAPLDRSPRIRT